MTRTFEATYDGSVLRLDQPLNLLPNSKVRITVETIDEETPTGFLAVAMGLNLDGPEDWSRNLDSYLYGTNR
jgi:hypothetical protein